MASLTKCFMQLPRSLGEGSSPAGSATVPAAAGAATAGGRDGSRRRIVHIITGLERGGAESVLYRLIGATRDAWDIGVISLTDEGFYGQRLRALGVSVRCCRMHAPGGAIAGFLRLLRDLRGARPDVVQTWMYHADLLGGVAARLAGCRAVLWGIRNLTFQRGRRSWTARAAARLCALLSRTVPVAIVSCSAAAAVEHRRRGYDGGRMQVIPNGYDCTRLRVDRAAGARLREGWGLQPTQFLIGMVARWDPLKDHANLLAALEPLMREHPGVRCVLVGAGMDAANRALHALLQRHALQSRVVLAGACDDIAAVMNALDLHVLCSRSEAFPNVVAEAMACGTPCVVTDVGDAAAIVGEQGWCVAPADPQALHAALRSAIERLAGDGGESLRTACRQRIERCFGQEQMVAAYEDAWSRAIDRRAA
jgi:glycosyltransferase involved in cell wall biosynthesis